MGFFGKKKPKHGEPTPSRPSNLDSFQSSTAPPRQERRDLLKTLPYPSKSVRFASDVSDDEGGFVTDSELEMNRSTRYGSLRVRPSPSMLTSAPSAGVDRTFGRSQSYDHGRSQSYSERQQHIQPSRAGSLWNSNGVSRPYQNGNSSAMEDDYMSDSSTASSFARGARLRSSLPILKHTSTKPVGLVFLTYQNETKKTALPREIKNLDTIKAMFLRCFPQQLTPDMLNSPKRRFYILDRSSNKFFLLVHLNEVRDGTMLKLVDSDALTPNTVRRSHSAHSALTTDSHYFSEPEFDFDSSRRYNGQRQPIRMSLTKETNIDDPLPGNWSHGRHTVQSTLPSQPSYHSTGSQVADHMTATSDHMTSSSHSLMNSGTTQGSYIPPQVLHSTVHSTKLDQKYMTNEDGDTASVTSKDSLASRNRMAKMESQIANLTAWVQTALTSRPGSSASDRISELSFPSNRSSMSGTSSSTPQPGVSVEMRQNIVSASEKVKDLKKDFKHLRRIHEAQAESIQDTIKDAFNKIQSAVNNVPGAKHSPLRSQRQTVDVSLDAYMKEQSSIMTQISELEACVSELRSDVVSKRCHVNIVEVEALALNLSKATRRAADIKAKFPRIVKELKSVSEGEIDSVIQQHGFIRREPERIEDALKRCKTVTNVLFTLKRLAAIDGHRTAVVPKLHTRPVEDSVRKELHQEIEKITPNHSDRLKSIQNAEKSLARRKEFLLSKDVLKFEKSLELASKSLKDAETIPRTDVNVDKGIENLLAQAKEIKQQSPANSPRRIVGNEQPVVRRAKPLPAEQSLSFIQNRDSIHWDAESDSDEDSATENGPFVDVTETPVSAFTIVSKIHDPQFVNGNHGLHEQTTHNSNNKQTIPNGKVYAPPDMEVKESKRKDLQQQFHRLQEMQRNHRHHPTSSISPPNSTLSRQSNLKTGVGTFATSRPSNGGKPVIAPKPQLRPSVKLSTNTSQNSEQDYSSSSDSEGECLTIKEPKSTTV